MLATTKDKDYRVLKPTEELDKAEGKAAEVLESAMQFRKKARQEAKGFIREMAFVMS